jgi:hypothetical protein
MEAAEKYCAREGISKGNVTQIREFIKQNTKSGLARMRPTANQNVFE